VATKISSIFLPFLNPLLLSLFLKNPKFFSTFEVKDSNFGVGKLKLEVGLA